MFRLLFYRHPTLGPLLSRLQNGPSWPIRLALAAAAIVIAVPVVLLVLAALLVGVVVFVVFGTAALASWYLRRLAANLMTGSRDDGRRNVRVIRVERVE